MFKVKHGLAPISVVEIFKPKCTGYKLRNGDFYLPRFETVSYGKHSLRYFGPFLWSKLSNKDRNLPSLNSFKRNIRTRDLSSLVDNNCSCCGLCSS